MRERKARLLALTIFCTIGFLSGPASGAEDLPSPSPVPASPAPMATVLLPRGTLFVVATRRSYKSYGAQAGTKVTYEVAQDIVVNGYVVAKAGDAAEGQILNAREGKPGSFFSAREGANLRLSVDNVFSFCGDTLAMDFARSEYRRKQGLFGGKVDLEVSKGQKYLVPSDRVQKVCGEKTDEPSPPVPDDALLGDKD